MSNPEYTFFDHPVFVPEQVNRVRSSAIKEGEFYIAIAKVVATQTTHEAVAFPVRLEKIVYPDESLIRKPMATIAMQMILLDQDFQPSQFSPFKGTINDGLWKIQPELHVERGARPITMGYFLKALPDDPWEDALNSGGDYDPRILNN